jgi:beta-1,2-mannobiose phosphorylase / 1,2-beta-oligomannan phosphorylase
MADIATRFAENPILRPEDVRPSVAGMKVECLLNPGVFRYEGRTWLLLRVAERPEQRPGKTSLPVLGPDGGVQIVEFDHSDPALDRWDPRVISYAGQDYLTTMSHLRLVSSTDGIHFVEPADRASIFGQGDLESYGIEDCRVVQIGTTYYLTFTQVSPHGVGVGLRSTTDWRAFHHHGMILPPHNKDCAIFDEKIAGVYYALHRPSSPQLGGNYIWIAQSPDLEHWGHHRCIARTRQGMWDSVRVGAGAAPIRTPRGWLEIYHGATADPVRYCLGALLLDLDEPWRVLARSREPIMEPIAPYEQAGFLGNVVFTNGHLVEGDRLTVYYGASDSVICGARLSIRQILDKLVDKPLTGMV